MTTQLPPEAPKNHCTRCGAPDAEHKTKSGIGIVRLCASCLVEVAPNSKTSGYADHIDEAFQQSVQLEFGVDRETQNTSYNRPTKLPWKLEREYKAKRGG